MPDAPAPAGPLDATPPVPRRWFAVALAALALAAAAATFTEVFNYDIFWHLAAGEWMLRHGQVLGTDPFSVAPEPRWVNVHWLFQAIVASLHGAGGFAALTVLKSLLAVATMAVFALSLRRGVPVAWLIVCGLVCIATIETRFRVRPEAFTILFLTITIALAEHVRRGGDARCLWLLVPIMLAWVNLHGLYVLGPAVFWSAMAGDALDRRFRPAAAGRLGRRAALLPLLAATAACLVSPWPLAAPAQPLLLWTRISGQKAAFSLGVSEFLPTWQSPFYLVLAAVNVLPAAAACAGRPRRIPLGHVAWLVGLGALAVLARRNVALLGPVCAYLLALHGGALLREHTRRPRPVLAATLTLAAAALALAVAAGCATEWLFRRRGVNRRFGCGLYRPHYPVAAAEFLGRLEASGDVFCDNWGDAGTFIYHSRPRRVWMDGRLEAHPLDRYLSQGRLQEALRTAAGASRAKLHEDLRFFFVRSLSGEHLRALRASPRFRLIFVEPAGAVFVRTDWRGPGDGARSIPARPDLSALDRPLETDGDSVGIISRPAERRRWWRQNPPSPCYRPGAMFLWLGWQDAAGGIDPDDLQSRRLLNLSIRYLTGAADDGITDRQVALGMLAQANQQRALLEDVTPSPAVPLDLFSARALCLYNSLDLRDLSDENTRRFAEQHVNALVRARQLDTAERAAAELVRHLPTDAPPSRRAAHRALHAGLAEQVRLRRERVSALPTDQPARARALAGPDMGLVEQAVAELRAASKTPENLLALGDLLLNAGRAEEAEAAYSKANLHGRRFWASLVAQPQMLLRPDNAPPAGSASDATRYYLALQWEQFGRVGLAAGALRDVVPEDPQFKALVERTRRALAWGQRT